MAHRDKQPGNADTRAAEMQAALLLTSLKGIEHARVECDAYGHVVRVEIVPQGVDDRAAMRNVQSALMAVLGQAVDINAIAIGNAAKVTQTKIETFLPPQKPMVDQPDVIELKIPAIKNGELNVAAKAAFETLRAAQASFHGFHFDGAELVRINGNQFVCVSLNRGNGEGRYCGAAPVLESVSAASARALLNAVGAAAMSGSALDMEFAGEARALNA